MLSMEIPIGSCFVYMMVLCSLKLPVTQRVGYRTLSGAAVVAVGNGTSHFVLLLFCFFKLL